TTLATLAHLARSVASMQPGRDRLFLCHAQSVVHPVGRRSRKYRVRASRTTDPATAGFRFGDDERAATHGTAQGIVGRPVGRTGGAGRVSGAPTERAATCRNA